MATRKTGKTQSRKCSDRTVELKAKREEQQTTSSLLLGLIKKPKAVPIKKKNKKKSIAKLGRVVN
jgi:hypothetical protein